MKLLTILLPTLVLISQSVWAESAHLGRKGHVVGGKRMLKNGKGKRRKKNGAKSFQPEGKYRCTWIKCIQGLETYTPAAYTNETHTWELIERNIYNLYVDENPYDTDFHQSFNMLQYPPDPFTFEGIIWERFEPGSEPPYFTETGGYERDFKPVPEGQTIPDLWYTPPLSNLKLFFEDENNYSGVGLFIKPGGPRVCNFQMCTKLDC